MRPVFIVGIFLLCTVASFSKNRPAKYFNRSVPSFRLSNSVVKPFNDHAIHDINNIRMMLYNNGCFGASGDIIDPVMGDTVPGSEFPIYSGINHLFVTGLWVGGVVGRDTLVSTFDFPREFNPDKYPEGQIVQKSIYPASPFYADDAVSEQDFIAVFYDTLTDPLYVPPDAYDTRTHRPLNIEVTMKSYAWSFDYVADFIIYDFTIRNISLKNLEEMYIGMYIDGDIWSRSIQHGEIFGINDDLCGFIRTSNDIPGMNFPISINSCYFIDNDGDPYQGQFEPESPRSAAGVRILATPGAGFDFTFNWWLYTIGPSPGDFGPRQIPPVGEDFRRFGINIGYPLGDRNKYYVMSQPEFDYNQVFTALDNTSSGWMPAPADAADIADGAECVALMSTGPFNLKPGFETKFTIAWLCGENVHNNPTNFEDNFNPYFPYGYLSNLDFSDFALNAMWASWIYDNPGYDTDGDGYLGEYEIICVDSLFDDEGVVTCLKKDTVYYSGDGVPDYRAATPPPPPTVRILPGIDRFNHGYLKVRWNGLASETTRDIFSGELDFEGYRVKISLSPDRHDFSPLASYDLADYSRYYWSDEKEDWLVTEAPFSLDRLREMYGPNFEPLWYDIDNFLAVHTDGVDSFYYFESQDWNYSTLTDSSKIFKRFPDEPYPSSLSTDSASLYYPEELTDEGYLKYFEYEYLISDLLVAREYFVAVTAFDYGAAGLGLAALETNPKVNMVTAFAQNDAAMVERKGLDVIVYPNPYRIDGLYRRAEGGGFEGRGRDEYIDDRVRVIHFTNLPHKCTISIFSIDGDLIREIDHNYPIDHPQAMHESWDVITRNAQVPVSGIYYYVVESAYGTQIGKLVLIM